MTTDSLSARELAFLSLKKIENGGYSNIEISASIEKSGLTREDRALYSRLVCGTVERTVTADHIISRFSKTPVEKIEPAVRLILRMGIYQILYMDRIPDSAAVNECVNLAKKYTHRGTEGFVNGILRNISRNKGSLPMPGRDDPSFLSVTYSCPEEIVRLFVRDYGAETAEKILSAFLSERETAVRVNTLKTTAEDLARATGGKIPPGCPNAVILPHGSAIGELEPLSDGRCFVQDISSQICVGKVGAGKDELVIDTCACPGGKSFGMAADMENRGKVISLDLHKSKLSLIESGAKRLGIDIIEAFECDGKKGLPEFFGKADRVLCDVPCSGLGVLAKKPEMRFKKTADIEKLPPLQLEILSRSALYVKDGGRLVYSTCTLNKKENEENIAAFLRCNHVFSLSEQNTILPDETRDGFFYAVMEKNNK